MINQLQAKYQLSILSVLGVVSVLGIFPFVVIRYLEGNTAGVIIDLVLMLGIITFVSYARYSNKPRVASVITALIVFYGFTLSSRLLFFWQSRLRLYALASSLGFS